MLSCTRSKRLLGLLAVLALAGTACRLETATGAKGSAAFETRFADVQELALGHTVRISDVVVGTVTGMELDGYDAVVEYSIVDGRDLPVGTTAAIASTSLLGENYVQLRLPDAGAEAVGVEVLASGSEIPSAGTGASVEELAIQLLALTRAVQGRDVAAIVEAGAIAIGPRGQELGGLIGSVGDLAGGLAAQSAALGELLDNAEVLLAALAPEAATIGGAIDSAADASATLARQRERLVDTVEGITTLAVALDAEVLAPHRERLDRILADVVPVASLLESERDRLSAILARVRVAAERIPSAIFEGGALSYAWLHNFSFGGTAIDTDTSEGSTLADQLGDLLLPNPGPGA